MLTLLPARQTARSMQARPRANAESAGIRFANPYRVGSSATCAGGVLGGVIGAPLDLNLANPITCRELLWAAVRLLTSKACPSARLQRSRSADSAFETASRVITARSSALLSAFIAVSISTPPTTWSKSMDTSSTDPGSTAGSGKPDVPNTGLWCRAISAISKLTGQCLTLIARIDSASTLFTTSHQFKQQFLKRLAALGLLSGQNWHTLQIFALSRNYRLLRSI